MAPAKGHAADCRTLMSKLEQIRVLRESGGRFASPKAAGIAHKPRQKAKGERKARSGVLVQLWMSKPDLALIDGLAVKAGLSRSAYLRMKALGT